MSRTVTTYNWTMSYLNFYDPASGVDANAKMAYVAQRAFDPGMFEDLEAAPFTFALCHMQFEQMLLNQLLEPGHAATRTTSCVASSLAGSLSCRASSTPSSTCIPGRVALKRLRHCCNAGTSLQWKSRDVVESPPSIDDKSSSSSAMRFATPPFRCQRP